MGVIPKIVNTVFVQPKHEALVLGELDRMAASLGLNKVEWKIVVSPMVDEGVVYFLDKLGIVNKYKVPKRRKCGKGQKKVASIDDKNPEKWVFGIALCDICRAVWVSQCHVEGRVTEIECPNCKKHRNFFIPQDMIKDLFEVEVK